MNDWVNDVDDILGNRQRRGARSQDGLCLSQGGLDRLALGEVSPAEAETAHAHLATCPSCADRKATLDRDRLAFASEANFAALAADALARASLAEVATANRHREISWWRRLMPALAVVAATAGAVVLLPRLRNPSPTTDPTGITTKGGLGLTLYVLHTEGDMGGSGKSAPAADAQGTLHLGEPLHPGDRIRLQLLNRRDGDGHAMVLAVDQTARVSVYHPPTSGAAGLRGGAAQLLPNAIELDATLGPETIVALSCATPIAADVAVAAVQQSVTTGANGTTGLLPGDLGLPCKQARYVIKKVPR